MADVNLLLIDGRPASFQYGYHHHGQVSVLRGGFGAASSGLDFALAVRSIEDSCRRGDRLMDLGPGAREGIRDLRTRIEFTYRLTYTPLASWRSQAVRFGRWASARFSREATLSACRLNVAAG
jgi:hypothetical protein